MLVDIINLTTRLRMVNKSLLSNGRLMAETLLVHQIKQRFLLIGAAQLSVVSVCEKLAKMDV